MSEFNEFKNTLTAEVMNGIFRDALDYADEHYEKMLYLDESDRTPADYDRFFNTCVTLKLLEKYHNWNKE